MHQSTMLLISDDPAIAASARRLVGPIEGLGVSVVSGVDEAYGYEAWDRVALILVHQKGRAPATDVERLLRLIAAARRPVSTIVLGDPYDADRAMDLLRLGVADYIGLPIDGARLASQVEVLTVRAREAGPGPGVAAGPAAPPSPGLGASGAFEDDSEETIALMTLARRAAPRDVTILIGGEAGTGKDRLARHVHELSGRRDAPFLAVACGAGSQGAAEAGLFGDARGEPAGQGARPGSLAEVGRGTLFLDDVDLLSPAAQARLLRAIEDGAFEPIGPGRPVAVRARLIAATARPLEDAVSEGRFRSDLYFRLNVVSLHLPALRVRPGAVSALAPRIAAEAAARLGRPAPSIDADAMAALEAHDWPGNDGELRDAIERSVAASPGRSIRREDLPPAVREGRRSAVPLASPAGSAGRASLAQIKGETELARITRALEKHANNRLRAASELGISRMTLYKKLYKYGIMQHST